MSKSKSKDEQPKLSSVKEDFSAGKFPEDVRVVKLLEKLKRLKQSRNVAERKLEEIGMKIKHLAESLKDLGYDGDQD